MYIIYYELGRMAICFTAGFIALGVLNLIQARFRK